MVETTQQLLASIQQLRAEYERALAIRRELVRQRRDIAAEIRKWAQANSERMTAESRAAAWLKNCGL
jgi:hypothetical protein